MLHNECKYRLYLSCKHRLWACFNTVSVTAHPYEATPSSGGEMTKTHEDSLRSLEDATNTSIQGLSPWFWICQLVCFTYNPPTVFKHQRTTIFGGPACPWKLFLTKVKSWPVKQVNWNHLMRAVSSYENLLWHPMAVFLDWFSSADIHPGKLLWNPEIHG